MALKPDVMLNGNLESWASATDADNWVEIITGGSINQETTDVHAGSNAAKLIKTSGSEVRFYNTFQNLVIPGKWYRFECWTHGDGSTPFILEIVNTTANKFWNGSSWQSGQFAFTPNGASGPYVRFTQWFRFDLAFNISDFIRLLIVDGPTVSGSFFTDSWSLVGPYDHPIVEITGTIRSPSGAALVGTGVITARLNGVGQVSDGTNNKTIPPAPQAFPVVNGVVAMGLIPITNITLENGETPLWLISYNLPGYPSFTESWNLGLESPIDITQVPKG